jgi:hypothetical protein
MILSVLRFMIQPFPGVPIFLIIPRLCWSLADSPAAIESSPRRAGVANQDPAMMPAHSVRGCSAKQDVRLPGR